LWPGDVRDAVPLCTPGPVEEAPAAVAIFFKADAMLERAEAVIGPRD